MTNTKLMRIAWLSRREPQKRFDCLLHHCDEGALKRCFHALDGRKAVGIDGVTKARYGERLDLRMKRMAYRPQPLRQGLIPKEGKPGAIRPLGISILEDKIVREADAGSA